MEKRKKYSIFSFAAIVVLVLVVLCGGLLILESTVLHPEEDLGIQPASKTITRNGTAYFPRQDINTILIMGIDETGYAKDSLSYNNAGEADMIMLAVFDEKEKCCNILSLNRDTMMEIPVLGLGGKQAGTKYAQLALAHTYGSGLVDSCENTRKAVSDFLNGIPVDYYVSVYLDAIPVMNDSVGGVTVTVTDDFSGVDEHIPMGRVTLQGEQAKTFVQTRWNVGDHLNLSRMERQKEYVSCFVEQMRNKLKKDENFLISVYEQVSPYIVSDMPLNTLNMLAERYEDYKLGQMMTVEGENRMGKEFYEFYPDMEKLDEQILKLFYAPK